MILYILLLVSISSGASAKDHTKKNLPRNKFGFTEEIVEQATGVGTDHFFDSIVKVYSGNDETAQDCFSRMLLVTAVLLEKQIESEKKM